jgi:hypothetical protein
LRGFSFGEKSAEEIIAMMLTGSAKADEAIRKWTSRMTDAWVRDLWENLFRKPSESQPVERKSIEKYLFSFEHNSAVNNALGIYLIVRKLDDAVAAGSGLSLSDYRATIEDYRQAAATRIVERLDSLERNGKEGTVVEFWSTLDKAVYVNPVGYKAYLADGGTNEALLGHLVGDQSRPTTLQKLLEDQAGPRKAWNFYVTTSQARFRNEAFRFFKSTLRAAIFSDLRNATPSETDYHKSDKNFVQRMTEALERETDLLTPGDIEDIPRTVLRVVARSRFFYTDAYKFLKAMDEIMTKDPSIEAPTAADMATAEMVADYLIEQLKLVQG